ncbi:MAG: hypothetical protein ACE5Q6_19550, partial [Dehalococcoidia bacterium]
MGVDKTATNRSTTGSPVGASAAGTGVAVGAARVTTNAGRAGDDGSLLLAAGAVVAAGAGAVVGAAAAGAAGSGAVAGAAGGVAVAAAPQAIMNNTVNNNILS